MSIQFSLRDAEFKMGGAVFKCPFAEEEAQVLVKIPVVEEAKVI